MSQVVCDANDRNRRSNLDSLEKQDCVLTLGEKGVLVKGGGSSTQVAAFHVAQVVETTGAGDAFTGGFAVALAEGKSLIEAARYGCAVAGISVTRPGTAPSMPHKKEVDSLICSQPLVKPDYKGQNEEA